MYINSVPEPRKDTLSIFVTEADKTCDDIYAMSDFMSDSISRQALKLVDRTLPAIPIISTMDFSPVKKAFETCKPVVQEGFVYSLDFDSLPVDIRDGLKNGIYHLGKSKQVNGNFRAVVVNSDGIRIKDLTLKREQRIQQPNEQTMTSLNDIAIQAQLQRIDAKLDYIIEMQDYLIDFQRNNTLVKPFMSARDKVVHAQNEADPHRRRDYLDSAVDKIEEAMNAIYLDLQTTEKRFLRLSGLPIALPGGHIDKYIGYIAQDLQLLAKYIGVLLQIFDFMGKQEDKADAYEKYRKNMLRFFTTNVGAKELPISLQIHNAFDAKNVEDKDIWMNMTKEMTEALKKDPAIKDVFVITGEEERYEQD